MVKRSTKSPSRAKASVLDRVHQLSTNLRWTWHPRSKRLFESMDPAAWEATGHNPILTIDALAPTRREVLQSDPVFIAELKACEDELKQYKNSPSWWSRLCAKKPKAKRMKVAYFCMEYGIHEHLPLYSGGLGVLAGDHLKSASDLGIPLTAIGMLWRKGYYRQELTNTGEVRILYPEYDFAKLPVTDTGKQITVPIGTRSVRAKIWKLQVGRVPLYLLDTDISANKPEDRKLTHHLYGGDNEYRIRQEVLLGVGGLMALDALGIKPTVFHLNEGHAAFCQLELLTRAVEKGSSFDKAVAKVRSHSVFTTHTPVPAGNDRFDVKLFSKYMKSYAKRLGVKPAEVLALGREDISNNDESFCMTVLALKLAERCNGVAKLHGATARSMWTGVYGVKDPDEVPIGHVTNGIHPETWIADECRPFYDKFLKPKWVGAGPEHDWWARAKKAPDADLWALRHRMRQKLITGLRHHLRAQLIRHGAPQDQINALYDTLHESALTIGFARRFATYKRAPLVFKDAKRLAAILNNADRPVQIIFSGKAHPRDAEGNDFVRKVYQMTTKAPFRGRIWFLENYDMSIGRLLTSGCDVWLNNPIRPMEASGTSGMKPPLNGGVNFSILDGWWPEGYNGKNGWAIGREHPESTRAKQDKVDAESIYSLLETEIVPEFYDRNKQGIPTKWVKRMRESMTSVCAQFSSHRMVADYVNGSYLPSHGG